MSWAFGVRPFDADLISSDGGAELAGGRNARRPQIFAKLIKTQKQSRGRDRQASQASGWVHGGPLELYT